MSTKTNYKRLQDNLEYLKLKQCVVYLDETIELANTQNLSHKSTIVTSNINFDEWTYILQDERVASAIVDRLFHHAYVISITGDSYSLRHHMQMME